MPLCPYCQSQKLRHASTSLNSFYSFIGRQRYHCRNCRQSFSLSSDFSQRAYRDTRILKEISVMLLAATILVSLILIIGYIEFSPIGIRSQNLHAYELPLKQVTRSSISICLLSYVPGLDHNNCTKFDFSIQRFSSRQFYATAFNR